MREPKEKAERPTLELLDDQCRQVEEGLVLNILRTVDMAKAAADMTDEERNEVLRPHEPYVRHNRMILREVVRQAAALGENAVLAEMNELGVERQIVDAAVERRTR